MLFAIIDTAAQSLSISAFVCCPAAISRSLDVEIFKSGEHLGPLPGVDLVRGGWGKTLPILEAVDC
jgi:hypothetical protein